MFSIYSNVKKCGIFGKIMVVQIFLNQNLILNERVLYKPLHLIDYLIIFSKIYLEIIPKANFHLVLFRQSIQQASKRRAMHFEELRSPSQQFIPTIRDFFDPIIEQIQTIQNTDSNDPKELDKERERMLQQDPSLVWRALRLLARQSPYFFVHNTQTVPSMAQFLVSTCEKIRREYMTSTTTITPTTSAAPTPPPATSTTNADEDDEDTTMDDEPLENPPSADETTHTDQETEEEATTTTNLIPKVDEDDDDDNRERRFASTKRTSV